MKTSRWEKIKQIIFLNRPKVKLKLYRRNIIRTRASRVHLHFQKIRTFIRKRLPDNKTTLSPYGPNYCLCLSRCWRKYTHCKQASFNQSKGYCIMLNWVLSKLRSLISAFFVRWLDSIIRILKINPKFQDPS